MAPWLHFCPARKKELCFHCARAYELGKTTGYQEGAFTWQGFDNWKKARDKFRDHAASKAHGDVLYSLTALPATEALKSAGDNDSKLARASLTKIITSLIYLAKQGLAIRGHEDGDGNFLKLLQLRASDCPELQQWLKRKETFIHKDCQNELLQLISNDVVRNIVAEVLNGPENSTDKEANCRYFSVIVDAGRYTGPEWC